MSNQTENQQVRAEFIANATAFEMMLDRFLGRIESTIAGLFPGAPINLQDGIEGK